VNSRIHVAVGVIYNSDQTKVLITKRTANQHLAGYWEFPGGKIKNNEDTITALSRELYEELGIVVITGNQLTTVSYDYPDKSVLLDVWQVSEWSGTPTGKENQELVWSDINNLANYKFPEANKHITQSLSLSPIYLLSPLSFTYDSRSISVLKECFSSGVKVFQLRLDPNNKSEIEFLINELNDLVERYDVKLILNDNPASLANYNISGIHLNSSELLSYETRPVGQEYILGASCHDEIELLHAEKINVNYAFLSPVFNTSSHPDKKAIGWSEFYNISKKVSFPVYALGGMSPCDLDEAKKNNAFGVAMISSIWNSTISVRSLFTNKT
jgi:8-oxo-dGTP diphosphatase